MSRFAALAALFLFCPCALADAAAGSRLGELLGGMQLIEARFRQTLRDESGEILQESAGVVELAHPGRFRWETRTPYEQLVVSDGETVWQYDPDLMQVVVRRLDRRADQIPALLLGGQVEEVERHYAINRLAGSGDEESFELLPREEGSPFARLAIVFRAGCLLRLDFTDGSAQRTSIEFEDVERPAAIAEERFRFETPPGVDEVIDE